MNEDQPRLAQSLKEQALENPEKFLALMKAMGQSSDFADEATKMGNEMLASKVEELVLNHIPCLSQGYAVLDEALSRLVPTRRNSAFPPGS